LKNFDGLEYTRDNIAIQLLQIETHASDGSALDAGCACIQERHLLALEGFSNEGVALSKNENEKKYYLWLSGFAREERKKILEGKFDVPTNKKFDCPPCAPCNCSGPVQDDEEAED
jgi:hypothetical protein